MNYPRRTLVGGICFWVVSGLKLFMLYLCFTGSSKRRRLLAHLRRVINEEHYIRHELEKFSLLSPDQVKEELLFSLVNRIEALRVTAERYRNELGDMGIKSYPVLFMNPAFRLYQDTLNELEEAEAEHEELQGKSAHKVRDWWVLGLEQELAKRHRMIKRFKRVLAVTP